MKLIELNMFEPVPKFTKGPIGLNLLMLQTILSASERRLELDPKDARCSPLRSLATHSTGGADLSYGVIFATEAVPYQV